jgi:hypothetical protein
MEGDYWSRRFVNMNGIKYLEFGIRLGVPIGIIVGKFGIGGVINP